MGAPINEIIEHLSALDVDIARTAVCDKKHAFLRDISSLLDSDHEERGRAISILQWLMPEREAQDTLVRALDNHDKWIRYLAAVALCEKGLPDGPTGVQADRQFFERWGDEIGAF